jgi:transcriptional regulator with XRE-family HTH domain
MMGRWGGRQKMAKKAPDPIDVEVGRRIRIQRMARGMSQTELGRRIGVTFQQVQKYEKGANRVGAGRLTRIAGVLEVPVSAFFGGSQTSEARAAGESGQPELEYLVQPGALRLLRAYGRIKPGALQRSVLVLVERIAGISEARQAGVDSEFPGS